MASPDLEAADYGNVISSCRLAHFRNQEKVLETKILSEIEFFSFMAMHLNELWIRNPFDQFDKKCHQVCLYVREFEGCGQEVSREINKCPSSSTDSIYKQCSCSITRSQSVKQREHLLSPDCRFSINLLNFLKLILADLLSCALRAHVTNCNIWRRPDWCLQ